MTPFPLTPQQCAQVEQFHEKYQSANSDVDFDHYGKPQFGPWNPYWHVYNYVREQYRPGKTLLCIGCGSGANALRYARWGYKVHGIDICPKAIEVARDAAKKYDLEAQAHFEVQPAENLGFPDDHFDLVVGVNVLHHVDTFRAIPEVHRVLKPGGTAIFKEPLQTPKRDQFRRSRLVTWLLPIGAKSLPKGLTYGDATGEHMLNATDFDQFCRTFVNLTIQRWRVLALLSVFVSNKRFLERCDWLLFKLLPFIRRLGDQAVLIAKKVNPSKMPSVDDVLPDE